jgi:hypothetical protein
MELLRQKALKNQLQEVLIWQAFYAEIQTRKTWFLLTRFGLHSNFGLMFFSYLLDDSVLYIAVFLACYGLAVIGGLIKLFCQCITVC